MTDVPNLQAPILDFLIRRTSQDFVNPCPLPPLPSGRPDSLARSAFRAVHSYREFGSVEPPLVVLFGGDRFSIGPLAG
jgi:hypothetical protein